MRICFFLFSNFSDDLQTPELRLQLFAIDLQLFGSNLKKIGQSERGRIRVRYYYCCNIVRILKCERVHFFVGVND